MFNTFVKNRTERLMGIIYVVDNFNVAKPFSCLLSVVNNKDSSQNLLA